METFTTHGFGSFAEAARQPSGFAGFGFSAFFSSFLSPPSPPLVAAGRDAGGAAAPAVAGAPVETAARATVGKRSVAATSAAGQIPPVV
jgi:hypothetical protein